MRFHLYIFFTMFCVHSFFFLFCFSIMLIWCPTVVSQHLSKHDKRGWLTRWPPRSFTNPRWHSAPLCLHWSTIVPLCFHLLQCSLMVGLLHAMAFMMLLLVGWVIWNNKPLTIDHWPISSLLHLRSNPCSDFTDVAKCGNLGSEWPRNPLYRELCPPDPNVPAAPGSSFRAHFSAPVKQSVFVAQTWNFGDVCYTVLT